jgi:glycosyltransferase involved in cell wall biosynthesis
MKHRLHVISLPHTQTTRAFSSCAYTEKVRKFCDMMTDRGHAVFLYAGEHNEARCAEHVACIREAERAAAVVGHYTAASFDVALPHWRTFNGRAIAGLHDRLEPRDVICLIGGLAQQPIAHAFPNHLVVEFGVGYGGSFAKHRVFESYAWMHTVYGFEARTKSSVHDADGTWFDAVIPGYVEVDQFPFGDKPDNYVLFLGRLIERKGIRVAIEAARAARRPLVVAGPGELPPGCLCDYRGEIGPDERGRLLAGAAALIAPTIYLEPFGNVVVEALTCGTPAVTTDWGAFTETVAHGVTGYRCRTLAEFVAALHAVDRLDRHMIRNHAVATYSQAVIAAQYETYFDRLASLWGAGWYAMNDAAAA